MLNLGILHFNNGGGAAEEGNLENVGVWLCLCYITCAWVYCYTNTSSPLDQVMHGASCLVWCTIAYTFEKLKNC